MKTEQTAEPTSTDTTAPTQWSRRQLLDEAAKLLGVDVKNSVEQVAHYCETGNTAGLDTARALLAERLARANAALDGVMGKTAAS